MPSPNATIDGNWTRTWYRPGKRAPADIARHLVKVLREPLAR